MNRTALEKKKDKKFDFPSNLEDMIKLLLSSEKMQESSKIFLKRDSYPFEISRLLDLCSEGKQISKLRLVSMRVYWSDQKFDESRSSFYISEKKSELLKSLDALQSYFDDPEERHIQYFRFKEKLKEMKDIADPKYWDLTRLIIGCIDATTNTEAEDLSLSHVKAFKKVIEEIAEDTDCSTVNSLLDILISENLKPVPNLQNLEPIEI